MTASYLRRLTAMVLACGLAGCTYQPTPANSPPESPSNSASPKSPLSSVTVAIDPGHNGGNASHADEIAKSVDAITSHKPCDTTGTETDDGYSEHEFNFDVASRMIKLLETKDAKVISTRNSDEGVGPCLTKRASLGNNSADVSISIHGDGGPADGHGFHIMEPKLIAGHTDRIVDPSHDLAGMIRDEYSKKMPTSNYIGTKGISPRDDMGGLNLSTIPKVMVECGNMRNSHDAKLLKQADFRQEIAEAIVSGLENYLKK